MPHITVPIGTGIHLRRVDSAQIGIGFIQATTEGGQSHEFDCDLDITSRGFGVRTVLMRFVH